MVFGRRWWIGLSVFYLNVDCGRLWFSTFQHPKLTSVGMVGLVDFLLTGSLSGYDQGQDLDDSKVPLGWLEAKIWEVSIGKVWRWLGRGRCRWFRAGLAWWPGV